MKKITRKAFTLIELLIVIAIIGVLAVTVIMTLNPGEAQKKGRDVQRLKDATTLQAALEQLIDSGVVISAAAGDLGDITGPAFGTNSITGPGAPNTGVKSQNCLAAANWLEIDVCAFIKTVPLDPMNNRTTSTSTGANATATAQTVMQYNAIISGSNYEIQVRQESIANWQKLNGGDGGDDPAWYEVFGGVNTLL